jgi:Protein of unknown function (DUF2690)
MKQRQLGRKKDSRKRIGSTYCSDNTSEGFRRNRKRMMKMKRLFPLFSLLPVFFLLTPPLALPRDRINLDHTSPVTTGCAKDAVTRRTAPFQGTVKGKLELRYSPKCHTVWGRLILEKPAPDSSRSVFLAGVKRNAGPEAYDKCRIQAGKRSCYTPQLNVAGVHNHAEGYEFDETFSMDTPLYEVKTGDYDGKSAFR